MTRPEYLQFRWMADTKASLLKTELPPRMLVRSCVAYRYDFNDWLEWVSSRWSEASSLGLMVSYAVAFDEAFVQGPPVGVRLPLGAVQDVARAWGQAGGLLSEQQARSIDLSAWQAPIFIVDEEGGRVCSPRRIGWHFPSTEAEHAPAARPPEPEDPMGSWRWNARYHSHAWRLPAWMHACAPLAGEDIDWMVDDYQASLSDRPGPKEHVLSCLRVARTLATQAGLPCCSGDEAFSWLRWD
jgi:hypothetical protein